MDIQKEMNGLKIANGTADTNGNNAANAVNSNPNDEKREDYLSWDDYFMSTAFLSSMRSKDPVTQVGAVIVNKAKRIVGIGYNGFPRGCPDEELPWGKTDADPLANKYMYVCHAEMNAIMNKNAADVEGCSIYVALFPCNECAKIIIQAGISEIVYFSDKHKDKDSSKASRKLLELARVSCRQYIPSKSKITIDFDAINR